MHIITVGEKNQDEFQSNLKFNFKAVFIPRNSAYIRKRYHLIYAETVVIL